MSLHADLLRQARQLAFKEPRRPSQASLPPGHFRVVLRSLSPARGRGDDAHVFGPRSGGSARLPGTCVRPRRHEEGGAAVLGRWGFSKARPGDERPGSPTGAHWRCGNLRRPSAGAPRSRLRHDTPLHATGRDRLGGPCGDRHSGIGTPCERAFRQMCSSQGCSRSGTCASEGGTPRLGPAGCRWLRRSARGVVPTLMRLGPIGGDGTAMGPGSP